MDGGMRNDQWARADVISDKERDVGGFHSVDPWKCMKALKSQESLRVSRARARRQFAPGCLNPGPMRGASHPGASGWPRCPSTEEGRAGASWKAWACSEA